jgi:hypothetical protein
VVWPAPQAVTRRLSHLATEVLAAKQRSKALTAESPGMATPGNTGGIGSVEHTLKVGRGIVVVQLLCLGMQSSTWWVDKHAASGASTWVGQEADRSAARLMAS